MTDIAKRFGPLPTTELGLPCQAFYECGICGHMHPAVWDGDCRDDANRFTCDELDQYFPAWIEVAMPTWDDAK